MELFFPWSSMGQEALELSRFYKVNESDVLGGLSVPPKVGDRWKANFNRFDHGRGEVRRTNLSWGTIRYKEGDIVSGWGVSPLRGLCTTRRIGAYWSSSSEALVGKNIAESSGKENNHATQ